ncbi:hypothetical protein G647_00870 [Cladophialophora carrionii CBS 160.54]|uniref:RBR-type E3 ubiquitin transferase n=1 Tax=Cladophialophora carrionii CBS 160.54 TaxID=1279043 RepID=V9DP51_9EURO|nr:uncharacterized protein G647_00870 [Cladophialophora carrionii CBS 160.54]ETI28421.1 hypothetical protein G647_00870 [Cladophialophora carrionii CBS 160.54]
MASFPPKCCAKPLRISVWGSMLEPDILDRYKEIEAEFSTNRPLYCASPKCSTFIPEGAMVPQDELGLCPKCATSTCKHCRRLMDDHAVWDTAERICPKEEEGLTKLYELGSEKKWKQCPTCLNMVEKTEGCNHMDCICGVEFCYRCGNLFDEDDACECELNTWDNEDDGEEEEGDEDDDDDDDDEDGDEHDEDEESDEDEWPNYRLAVDLAGRPRCLHPDLSPLGAHHHTCHGCLQRNLLLTCEDCALELCQACVDKIRNASGGEGDDGEDGSMDLDRRGMERGSRLDGIREWPNNSNPYALTPFR